jgi:hypothetical protein
VYINTRVLIITTNVQFSMQTTQALERAGAFKVAPFTSAENALASLQQAPQDVVLLDTTLQNLNVEAFIQQVRAVQPDIAFILLPESSTNQHWVARLNLHGTADYNWTARRLVPIIKQAQKQVYDDQPKTAQVKAAPPRPSQEENTKRIAALSVPGDDPVEFLLSDAADGETRVEVLTPEDSKGIEVFRKLADEEPPMPSFEESATIRDLRERLVNPALLKEINGIARDMDDEDDDTPPSSTTPPEHEAPSPAALILASSADDSTPLDAFSLDTFLARIQEQLAESGVSLQPLPSWVKESEKYVREPDFLDDDLPGIITPSTPLEYTAPVTTPNASHPPILIDDTNMDTERSQPIIRSYPVLGDDVSEEQAAFEEAFSLEDEGGETRTLPAVSLAAASDPLRTNILDDSQEFPALVIPPAPDLPPLDKEAETNRTPTIMLPPAPSAADGERAYIEQLTVTLVQVSLELTAEATLLIREGEIIAHDGVLPIEDVRELFSGQNWEAEPLQGRIRFLTLPANGQDYMLYSRGLETGVTLGLIFAGTLPLYTIRRQGKRLAEAMTAVPAPPLASAILEAVVEPPIVEEAEELETGDLLPYTYLWPVRDESVSLWPETREALMDYYERQLPKRGWELHVLDVQEDYVYLGVSHPATQSAMQRLQDLQQRAAAQIAKIQGDVGDVWDTSYTVLIPGRALTPDEIQDFLEFARS